MSGKEQAVDPRKKRSEQARAWRLANPEKFAKRNRRRAKVYAAKMRADRELYRQLYGV